MTSKLAVIPRDWSYPVLEYRTSLENPQTPLSYPAEWLLDIFQGGRTDSGIRVSELTAFQVSTFLTCTDLIAGKISSLPFDIQERSFSKVNQRAVHRISYDHELYELIHLQPNIEMSRQTFLKAFLLHCLAWSNGYAEIQRDASKRPAALWPRNPAKTRPRRMTQPVLLPPEEWRPYPVYLDAGTLAYNTTDGIDDNDRSEADAYNQPERIIPMEDMLHVPGLSFDGRLGQSVVWLARQTIGLALATEKFGAKYFANFARPGGLLTLPMNLRPEDKEQARRSWMEAQGGENANRIAVMPPGFEWKAMSNNPQEAQTIESRTYIRTEIASIFHVPVRMVGDTTKGSKASTEQENQELLDYTLEPWMSAIKLEWKRKLFRSPNAGRGRTKNPFFVSFDVTSMIRGDAVSRERFNASGRQWGYLNTNDILTLEGLNPIEADWAEQYWMPVNMTLSTTPIDPGFQDGSGQGAKPQPPPDEPPAAKTPPSGAAAGTVSDDTTVEDQT
jgi:HK97 family phage portal protein